MSNNEIAKKFFNKYFKWQYINELDNEFKSFIRILNKKDKQIRNISGWISTKETLPKAGEIVLIIRDYRKWDKKRAPSVDLATVGYFDKIETIGGPNSLTGYHKMKGIYFAVPAILHPESITHWQPIPNIPNQLLK